MANRYTDIVGADEMGYTDIVGADEMGADEMGYEVGARRAMQRARQPSGPAGVHGRVRDQRATVGRLQTAPLPLTVLPPGVETTITIQPQRVMRIQRLVLDAASLAGLFVTEFTVGADPQFVNPGAVPATMFQPTAVGTSLRGSTANPGITITIRVNNTTAAPVTLGGAINGETLE